MKYKSLVCLFLASFSIALITMSGGGCANAIAPSGGPRDSLPPLLVSVNPKDSMMGFAGERIVFTFNEFVEMDNAQANVIVSPYPKTPPTIESKLRTITVRLRDTLEEGTTYSINFGNSIKDINEGNVAKNLTYIFSTGNTIDDNVLMGKVIVAETGKSDSTMIVLLHRTGEDSALIKERPRYITRLDGNGNFIFRNLPAGQFFLYAMKDESNQRRYLSKSQLFAFYETPVQVDTGNQQYVLYAYAEKEETNTGPGNTRSAAPAAANDKDKRLKYRTSLENNTQDLLTNLDFDFTTTLKNFDSSKLLFLDETFKPVAGYTLRRDTSNRRITLVHRWKENTAYNIILEKEFAEDSAGRMIPRKDTISFKTLKEADYGSVHIRFNNIDLARKPVLQLVQSNDVKFSAPLSTRDFNQKLFKPGEYEIRILFDDNGNGLWDTGEFFKVRRQPEKVIPVTRKLLVKANWDADVTVEL